VLLFLFLLLVHTFLPDTLSCLFRIFFSSSIGNLMLGNKAIHISKKIHSFDLHLMPPIYSIGNMFPSNQAIHIGKEDLGRLISMRRLWFSSTGALLLRSMCLASIRLPAHNLSLPHCLEAFVDSCDAFLISYDLMFSAFCRLPSPPTHTPI
jgi:hypothetical protein